MNYRMALVASFGLLAAPIAYGSEYFDCEVKSYDYLSSKGLVKQSEDSIWGEAGENMLGNKFVFVADTGHLLPRDEYKNTFLVNWDLAEGWKVYGSKDWENYSVVTNDSGSRDTLRYFWISSAYPEKNWNFLYHLQKGELLFTGTCEKREQ